MSSQAVRPERAEHGAAAGSTFAPSRTPWGDPDLQGHWLPAGGSRVETPAGKPWDGPMLSGADAAFSAFFDANRGNANAAPQPPRGATAVMVVDPPDGRIPLQPWALEKRSDIMAHQDKVEYLDPRVRCLQSGVPRAHFPVEYNTYQFLQIPGYVVILYEWNHMFRYIPLDGRPHISPDIKLPMGDSRGRWEGPLSWST